MLGSGDVSERSAAVPHDDPSRHARLGNGLPYFPAFRDRNVGRYRHACTVRLLQIKRPVKVCTSNESTSFDMIMRPGGPSTSSRQQGICSRVGIIFLRDDVCGIQYQSKVGWLVVQRRTFLSRAYPHRRRLEWACFAYLSVTLFVRRTRSRELRCRQTKGGTARGTVDLTHDFTVTVQHAARQGQALALHTVQLSGYRTRSTGQLQATMSPLVQLVNRVKAVLAGRHWTRRIYGDVKRCRYTSYAVVLLTVVVQDE